MSRSLEAAIQLSVCILETFLAFSARVCAATPFGAAALRVFVYLSLTEGRLPGSMRIRFFNQYLNLSFAILAVVETILTLLGTTWQRC